jgi:ribosome maturation factor RimP
LGLEWREAAEMPGVGREELRGPVEAALDQAGFELVELKLVPRGGGLSVQIFIDHRQGPAGVTLDDCTRASRVVQDEVDLDRYLPGRYVLEVSSPGIDRPLTRPAHYRRFHGEAAVVRLKAARGGELKLRGTIGDSDEEAVCLELEGGATERLLYAEIASAHLNLDPWKRRLN